MNNHEHYHRTDNFFDSIHGMRSYDPAQNNNANDDPSFDWKQAERG